MIYTAFLLLLLMGLLRPLQAEPVPTDDDERWTVGICVFQDRDLSAEHAYLTVSLPLLLRERLEPIPTHVLSSEEARGTRREIIRRERRRLQEGLEKARRERDELLFRDLKEAERQKQLEARERTIGGLLARLAALAEVEPERIEVADRKPVEFLEGRAEGGLLEPPAFSALRLARERGVELLIGGLVQELQGYLYLEIFALNTALEEPVYSYRDALRPTEVYAVLEEAADSLAEIVLGQPFGTLTLPELEDGCRVWLDGRFEGTGLRTLRYLEPGARTVRVRCPDGRVGEQSVVLGPGQTLELSPGLGGGGDGTIRLTSDPPGARVWSGSLFLGVTPLDLPRKTGSSRLLLRLEGYGDTAWYLEPAPPREVRVPLQPLLRDPSLLQRQERDRFYRAFGLWALSFPLPFFLYSQTVDYAVAAQLAYDQNNLSEAKRLVGRGRLSWYGYLGGMGLSAGLFVNLIFNLRDYIRSADRKAGG